MKSSKVFKIACLSAFSSMIMVGCFGGFSPKDLKGGMAKEEMSEDTQNALKAYGKKPLKDLSAKDHGDVFDKLLDYLTSDAWNFEKMGQLMCHVEGLMEEEKNKCVEARETCLKDVESDSEIKKEIKEKSGEVKPQFLKYAKDSVLYPMDLIAFFNILNKFAERAGEVDCDSSTDAKEDAFKKFEKEMSADFNDIEKRIKANGGKDLKSELETLFNAFEMGEQDEEEEPEFDIPEDDDMPGKGHKGPKRGYKAGAEPKKGFKGGARPAKGHAVAGTPKG